MSRNPQISAQETPQTLPRGPQRPGTLKFDPNIWKPQNALSPSLCVTPCPHPTPAPLCLLTSAPSSRASCTTSSGAGVPGASGPTSVLGSMGSPSRSPPSRARSRRCSAASTMSCASTTQPPAGNWGHQDTGGHSGDCPEKRTTPPRKKPQKPPEKPQNNPLKNSKTTP